MAALKEYLISPVKAPKDIKTQIIAAFQAQIGQDVENDALVNVLAILLSASSYLSDIAKQHDTWLPQLLNQSVDEAIKACFAFEDIDHSSSKECAKQCRLSKKRLSLLLGLLHYHPDWPVMDIVKIWSEFAEQAVKVLTDILIKEAVDNGQISFKNPSDLQSHGYFILALGKLGGKELNYSSDIDLIAFFEPDRLVHHKPDYAKGFFIKLTKDLIYLLERREKEGYIFRTDFRLRPDPGSTAVTLSTDAAYNYYEQFGQTWERSAFIKARPIAGDISTAQHFLTELHPFIWRKYLDYVSIDEIHAMKRKIQAHHGFADIQIEGHNIKIGRGGIREIEFFVQCQQLIFGGRILALQGKPTLKMLDALTSHHFVEEAVAVKIKAAYSFFRIIENNIQMMRDEQTHAIPKSEEDRHSLALMSGFENFEALGIALEKQLETVAHIYDILFADEYVSDKSIIDAIDLTDEQAIEKMLVEIGFKDAASCANIVSSWGRGGIQSISNINARQQFEKILPNLLTSIAYAPNSQVVLAQFDHFLRRLPAGLQFFSLLKSEPKLFDLMTTIFATAPRMTAILAARPRLFDVMLDPRYDDEASFQHELIDNLVTELARAPHYEDQLDAIRIFGQDHLFKIGVKLLAKRMTLQEAGNAFSQKADLIIQKTAAIVFDYLVEKYGILPGARWGVLGMGKLGSQEMTAASDLDLIILYDHDERAKYSNGKRALSPSQYFSRFTQYLITALSAPTAQGRLYEVDMRLRPSGRNGPVASRLKSFITYQKEEAWVWEHLALIRSRPIAASDGFMEEMENAKKMIFKSQKRSVNEIVQDTLDMKKRIFEEKKSHNIWDFKTRQGGQMDVELTIQALILIAFKRGEQNIQCDAYEFLESLKKSKLQNCNQIDILRKASKFYIRLMQVQRLCITQFEIDALPPALLNLLNDAGECDNFEQLAQKLQLNLTQVSEIADELLKAELTPADL